MVRLNKNLLTNNQLESLFTQLDHSIGKLSAQQAPLFISGLLGKEEHIMLAKRLAAIVLLVEGKSLYRTADILKISPTTAEKLKYKLDRGELDHLLSMLGKNKKEYFSFLQKLDSILHLGGILPHYNGLDRYRNL